jgi:hypothetical protein
MITHVFPSGRPSILQPCENEFKVKEQLSRNGEIGVSCKPAHTLEFNVFERINNDNNPGMSHEDKQFWKQMNSEFKRDSTGNWVAPLPFRSPRQLLGTDHLTCRGGVMVICFVQNFFFGQHKSWNINFFCRAKREFFTQNLTLGYMTKTLESDYYFFSSTKIRIFFSATLGIRIFF